MNISADLSTPKAERRKKHFRTKAFRWTSFWIEKRPRKIYNFAKLDDATWRCSNGRRNTTMLTLNKIVKSTEIYFIYVKLPRGVLLKCLHCEARKRCSFKKVCRARPLSILLKLFWQHFLRRTLCVLWLYDLNLRMCRRPSDTKHVAHNLLFLRFKKSTNC